jgi:hypothetical protein
LNHPVAGSQEHANVPGSRRRGGRQARQIKIW